MHSSQSAKIIEEFICRFTGHFSMWLHPFQDFFPSNLAIMPIPNSILWHLYPIRLWLAVWSHTIENGEFLDRKVYNKCELHPLLFTAHSAFGHSTMSSNNCVLVFNCSLVFLKYHNPNLELLSEEMFVLELHKSLLYYKNLNYHKCC